MKHYDRSGNPHRKKRSGINQRLFRKLRYICWRKNWERRLREDNQALSYSGSGFLTDILEYNGFAIRSIKCCGVTGTTYKITVDLIADRELFMKRLEKNRKHLSMPKS